MKFHSYFLIFLTVIGLGAFGHAVYANQNIEDKLVMGNTSSPIKVYFISDWFCPSCKKTESVIEEVYPKVQSKVAFYFIDHTINRESLNYTPYNIAFLMNSKPQYLKIRHLLSQLTDKVSSPKDTDIAKIAEKAKTQFKELPYTEVKGGLDFFKDITKKYQITSTPVIIVVNTQTNKTTKLQGASQLTKKNILKAIEETD